MIFRIHTWRRTQSCVTSLLVCTCYVNKCWILYSIILRLHVVVMCFMCHTALILVMLVMCIATIGMVTFSAVPCHAASEIHHFVIENMTPFPNGDPPEVIQSARIVHLLIHTSLQLVPEMFKRIHIQTAGWPYHHIYALSMHIIQQEDEIINTSLCSM